MNKTVKGILKTPNLSRQTGSKQNERATISKKRVQVQPNAAPPKVPQRKKAPNNQKSKKLKSPLEPWWVDHKKSRREIFHQSCEHFLQNTRFNTAEGVIVRWVFHVLKKIVKSLKSVIATLLLVKTFD